MSTSNTPAAQPAIEAQAKQAFKKIGKSISILSCTANGQRHASVSSAVCNVSNTPPSLLVCLEKSASLGALLTDNKTFAVNVLGAEQQYIVEHCMQTSGEQRFEQGEWFDGDEQLPLLRGSQANFCCRVVQIEEFATHRIVLANIEAAHCSDHNNGLIYLGGKFHKIDNF